MSSKPERETRPRRTLKHPAATQMQCYDPPATGMAFTFHGIGTMVYGERDYWPDGSFVTTEWFVAAYVPVFPIISKRISYTRNSDHSVYDNNGYFVCELLPLDRRQVASVYAWFAAVLGPVIVWGMYQDELTRLLGNEDWAAGLCIASSAIAVVVPYFLRKWAKDRKMEEWKRQNQGLCGKPL
jgi:hypothetical protein